MNRLVVIILVLCPLTLRASAGDSLLILFWNVENFFDYIDEGTSDADKEFSSFGSRCWTKKRFQVKCDAVAKSFLWIGEKYGRLPDVIGLAEVENRDVLWKILNNTLLRKCGYRIVHNDSQDPRGIDVALLYREAVFICRSVSFKVPVLQGSNMATRDILQVLLEDEDGERYNLIVNHHPSKYGGAEFSEGRRYAAMSALYDICDSLFKNDAEVPIIAMGDFNDTPEGGQFNIIDGILKNKADSLFKAGRGTIRYQGKWELIDMFMVSEDIDEKCRMDIVEIPFLMTYEKKYPGMKPLRTYSGPRYLGGVSDHCPIILCLFRNN